MTLDQKNLLRPFADVLADWDQAIINLPDDELERIEKACAAASTTNCWACTFTAAGVLLPMIRRSTYHRKQMAEAGRASVR